MRLTNFEKRIIFTIITIVFAVFTWTTKEPEGLTIVVTFWTIGRGASAIIVLFWFVLMHMTLSELIAFKYRIIKKDGYFSQYEAQVLKFYYFFIPTWQAVETKSHKYKTQNMFGAKSYNYYSTDIRYEEKSAAMIAIKNHKDDVVRHRKLFFERVKKENNTIEYL